MILSQECDEVLYRSCFAVEKRHYTLTTKNGSIRRFANRITKTQIIKKLDSLGKVLDEDYTLECVTTAEDVSHAITLVKNQIKKLNHIYPTKLYLSASDRSNFRYAIAKTPGPKGVGYKAGRPDRPIHYEAVREYLIKHCGAEETHGYEADDYLSMNNSTIMSHIDKDINMVAGKHYNWVTGERYIVPEGLGHLTYEKSKARGYGLIFFYTQLLTGDATDNIAGIPGIGDKKAYDLLKDCKEEQQAFDIVMDKYYNQYKENASEVIKEIADLLWMCRHFGDRGSLYLQERGFI